MDIMENTNEGDSQEVLGMSLDFDGGNTLQEAVRWSRFISIAGIVCGGVLLLLLLLVGPIFMGKYAEELPDAAGIIGLAIVLSAVYLGATIAAAVFLLRFTSLMKKGIGTQDQRAFNSGLKNLKIYFLIAGILSVLLLGLYIFNLINQF
jgi:hypothetical protein